MQALFGRTVCGDQAFLHPAPEGFGLLRADLSWDRDGFSIGDGHSRERKRDHELIPGAQRFFLRAATPIGTMGNPDSLAVWITPSCATLAGPLGPSGVKATS